MDQSPKHHLNSALNHAQEYIETQLEIVKLQTAKQSGKAVAHISAIVLATLFLMVFYIMINISAALFINTKINNAVQSFLIVSAANLVLGLLIIMMKKIVINPLQNLIIRLITE